MSPSIQVSADVTTNCLNIKCSKGGKPSHTRLHSILGKFSRACSHLISAETPSSERTKGKMWSSRSQAEADIYNQVEVRNPNFWHDLGVKFQHVQCSVSTIKLESVNNKGRRSRVGRGTLWGKQVIKMSSNTWSSARDTGGVLRVFSGHRDA